MLKKGISVFLSLTVLLLCVCSVPVFASEPEFDINDYSIEDLDTMTTAEKKELIANFIETYNPYGMRDLLEQEAQAAAGAVSAEPGIELQWKSDSDLLEEGQQIATHHLITLEAFVTYVDDYGFYNNVNSTQMLALSLYLAAASGLPDYDENDWGYAGHFFDPDTWQGLNLFYDSAVDSVNNHYYVAFNALRVNPYVNVNSQVFTDVLEELGRTLHYVQDVCEPHHASNLSVGVSLHNSFETFVNNRIDTLLPENPTISTTFYQEARSTSVADLTHDAAVDGKEQLSNVITYNESRWLSTGEICIDNAVRHSARMIYKLFSDCHVVA